LGIKLQERESKDYVERPTEFRVKVARFEALVLPHLDAAYNLARWMARNSSDGEDVAQEAMLRAFRFFDTFRGEDARVWLLTIVRNTYLTWIRRELPRQNSAEFDERMHTDLEFSLTPETEVLRQATAEQVRRAIQSLPAENREVILMREIEQLSYKEIAAVTKSPLGTVMSRLSRARSMLRHFIGNEKRVEVMKHHG